MPCAGARQGAARPRRHRRQAPEAPSGAPDRCRNRALVPARAGSVRRARHDRGRDRPHRGRLLAARRHRAATRQGLRRARPSERSAVPIGSLTGGRAGNRCAARRGNPELASRRRQDHPRHAARRSTRSPVRDPLSKAKYAALRARGHGHARALRGVANRLLGVVCAMLENQTVFNPARARQAHAAWHTASTPTDPSHASTGSWDASRSAGKEYRRQRLRDGLRPSIRALLPDSMVRQAIAACNASRYNDS